MQFESYETVLSLLAQQSQPPPLTSYVHKQSTRVCELDLFDNLSMSPRVVNS